ncbi:hypothetical protein ANCDUO_06466 [Ancylostoma duodenale]|uniref:G-protein coupled receptors family 1 profile domain-containing protein n=1 Tax=Ancylostoma duodenale TaxID=51022 RepID=A0A0C2GW05_9BILA|nr:hypothetical protein ANCDUO_06466 [Ancylostoma duodenale]
MNDFPASIKANNVNLLGNLANYSDIVFLEKIEDTSHEDDLFKTIVGIAVITLAVLGILTNILVLILSFCHVTGDFGNFVANLAVVDIVCGAVFAFMGYINVQGGKMPFSIGCLFTQGPYVSWFDSRGGKTLQAVKQQAESSMCTPKHTNMKQLRVGKQ